MTESEAIDRIADALGTWFSQQEWRDQPFLPPEVHALVAPGLASEATFHEYVRALWRTGNLDNRLFDEIAKIRSVRAHEVNRLRESLAEVLCRSDGRLASLLYPTQVFSVHDTIEAPRIDPVRFWDTFGFSAEPWRRCLMDTAIVQTVDLLYEMQTAAQAYTFGFNVGFDLAALTSDLGLPQRLSTFRCHWALHPDVSRLHWSGEHATFWVRGITSIEARPLSGSNIEYLNVFYVRSPGNEGGSELYDRILETETAQRAVRESVRQYNEDMVRLASAILEAQA